MSQATGSVLSLYSSGTPSQAKTGIQLTNVNTAMSLPTLNVRATHAGLRHNR